MLTRFFDERHSFLRLTLLALSGVGYLTLLRDPAETRNAFDWATDAAALAFCFPGARWPFVNALGQAAALGVASLCGAADPVVVPEVGATWAVLELALRAPGWKLATAVAAISAVYLVDEADALLTKGLTVVYNIVLVVGLPVLFGANIRVARQLARQAEERAAAEEGRRGLETRAARADERTAIARELHDVVAHHMASIVLRVGVARHVVGQSDPRTDAVLDDVHATASAALNDLRQLVTVLRDPQAPPNEPAQVSIEPAALPAALAAVVDRARQTGIEVEAAVDPALSTIDAVRGLAVLRLTQEALTNVARHAGPTARARLTVSVVDGAVHWEVADDGGTGPAAVAPGSGHGITGMRERVEVLGGTLEAGPTGSGWTVRTTLPARIGQPA